MPLVIQMVDAQVSVGEPKEGVRVLVLRDERSEIQVQCPMSSEAASAIAARLEGRSLVIPGPPAAP